MTNKLAIFEGKEIRRTWHKNEWWFVIEDIVAVLTDSSDPKQYINKMKKRDEHLAQGWVQIVHTLSIETPGVKQEKEFAILTAEISKATFDMTPTEYMNFKGLKRENLRDHMD